MKFHPGLIGTQTRVQYVKMWMKNTFIPLDMIFVNNYGEIIEIYKMTTPKNLTPIGPDLKLKAVLEINGGLTTYLNINKGDLIIHPSLNGN